MQEEYLQWLERPFHFLEVLSTVYPFHLFLNVDTMTAVSAVGDSSTLPRLSPGEYLEICINSIWPSMDDIGDEMEKSRPLMNEGDLLEASSLYSLLDEKQAKRLQETWPLVESFLKEYGNSCSLNVAERHLTFSTTRRTTEPYIIDSKRLQETWPLVESFLKEYGNSCSLNVAERHLTFSTTRRTTEPYIIDKAWCLLELLSTTHVPVPMAIDIIDGSVEHDYIKIGFQEGGLCSIHGIKEEEYCKRWNCLRWSLQALSELKGCDLFLNAHTVTAVGTSREVSRLIRLIVEDCIISNVCPATAARNVSDNLFETYRPTENTEDPHITHMKMKYDGMAEITCFCRFYANATVLEKDWQMLQSCLKDYSNISCTLVANNCGMTVSIARSIGDSDIVGKAWDLLRLMSATKVPALLAEMILKGTLHCVFIKTGYDGGLCSKIGIKMRQFYLLLPRLEYILKNAASRAGCKLLIKGETIIVLGKYPAVLNLFEMRARKWLEEHKDDDYESRKD
ncbi:uncharacterized protein LOC133744910 [Rosa rugosa]|uniref:uncharacterized protein LOC133744910 n=1 Tax=Rosa rugosa TaxID=74645 RepID=UPI002B40B08F|nr:uncharacterized protein LOC133744910 [Rosa rugosa]